MQTLPTFATAAMPVALPAAAAVPAIAPHAQRSHHTYTTVHVWRYALPRTTRAVLRPVPRVRQAVREKNFQFL